MKGSTPQLHILDEEYNVHEGKTHKRGLRDQKDKIAKVKFNFRRSKVKAKKIATAANILFRKAEEVNPTSPTCRAAQGTLLREDSSDDLKGCNLSLTEGWRSRLGLIN